MEIRKTTKNGKRYTYISSEDIQMAIDDRLLRVDCCPFCKLERNRDIPSRTGSWCGDWCPECNAKEVGDEWQR